MGDKIALNSITECGNADIVPDIVNDLLELAMTLDASDLHIELDYNKEAICQLRIDGVLQPGPKLIGKFAENILGRLKVLAHLPTYITDIPQDGKFSIERPKPSEVRLSIHPTINGERAALRFAAKNNCGLKLYELGFDNKTLDEIKRLINLPEGLILLTGPAGSGKTTTIYSLLSHLIETEKQPRQILTIEDPVERRLEKTSQTEVNSNLTFADALRSALRQDPEIIMVGEIRDRETAEVAIQASLTGHLVIATIHSGTATGVPLRLQELGIPWHMISAGLTGVLAQRLLRKLCSYCNGRGCNKCSQNGMQGRILCCELMTWDKHLLSAKDSDDLRNYAIKNGFSTFAKHAKMLLENKKTTADELKRILGQWQK